MTRNARKKEMFRLQGKKLLVKISKKGCERREGKHGGKNEKRKSKEGREDG